MKKHPKMRAILTKIFGSACYIIQCACVAHCTFEYVGDFVLCSGPSMEPTITSNDILLTEHISPRLKQIDKGDVVIAKSPLNPKQNICKRVTGLPGDKMKIGFNSYAIVPKGHVWLEGDNLLNSSDSRDYGPVPQGLIRSRALCKIWPFSNFRIIS